MTPAMPQDASTHAGHPAVAAAYRHVELSRLLPDFCDEASALTGTDEAQQLTGCFQGPLTPPRALAWML